MQIPLPPNDRLTSAELLGRILVLHWADGHRGEIPLVAVRRGCPCAGCGAAQAKASLPVLSSSGTDQVRAVQAVGRYALQFFWADGHTSGIYSFDLLRQLCQCEECGG
jgi:DUF971 family protein